MSKVPQMTAKGTDTGEAGFTLSEVLIALAILTLIASLSSAAIVFAIRATENTGSSTQDRRLQAVRDLVETTLGQAMPIFGLDDGGTLGLRFEGEEGRVLFVGPAPVPAEIPGLFVIELSHSNENQRTPLILRYWPHQVTQDDSTLPVLARNTVLLNDVDQFEIRYGTVSSDGRWDWAEQWQSDADKLPQAVRMIASSSNDEGQFTTEWFVGLPLSRQGSTPNGQES